MQSQLKSIAEGGSVPPFKPLSFFEGNLAGTALLNQGVDLLVAQGIAAALAPENAHSGLHAFAVLGGGHLRHQTGSHLDVDGTTFIAGFTATRPIPVGDFTFGAFFERDEGHSSAHTRFTPGHGEVDALGVGLLAHLKSPETERGHFYAEATARAGRVNLDFDFKTDGRADAYKSRTAYGSASLGLGYVMKLNESSAMKLYGQYLWSHQGPDTVSLHDGDVKLEAIDSHRTRLGARWNRTVTPGGQLYFGAAWEREYDARAKASTSDYRLTTPKLKGDTAVIEAGFTLKPRPASPWTVDFNVQGHTGRREGWMGGFEVNYRF